ncbi:hypothetical protein [Sanguibacter sp. 25GB23B1]|uniref:hypothetical protein n=1 Tax=unclassified Sanguibacter TaxID=2645534 RepID=UPI0032AFDE29
MLAISLISTLSITAPAFTGKSQASDAVDDPYLSTSEASTLSSGETQPAYVELPYAIDVASAEKVATDASVAVMGFVFSQDTIYGEFFPTDDYTFDEFSHDFENQYGTQAEITSVITLGPSAASNSKGLNRLADSTSTDEVIDAVEKAPKFDAPPITRQGPFDEQIASAQAAMASAPETDSIAARVNGGTDWPGTYVDIYAMSDFDSESEMIGTWTAWSSGLGSSPRNLPEDWGLEFNAYTYDGAAIGTRPACLSGLGFWQGSDVEQWSINLLSGGTQSATQPYLDSATALDSCTRQDTTVGLGAPRNIGMASDGSSQVATLIQTSAGAPISSPAGFYWQAVSHDCPGGAASWCMGLNTARDLPLPDSRQSRVVFSYEDGRRFPACYRWARWIPFNSINCATGE